MTRNRTQRHRGSRCGASLLTFALTTGGIACSDAAPTGPGPVPTAPASPTAPSPPAAPATGSWVVRGTVIEDLPVSPDARPVAGALLRVFGGGRVVEVISGADGSYEADMPDGPFVRVVAAGPLYFSPCPTFRWGGAGRVDEPMDVHVLSGAAVSTISWGIFANQISGGVNVTWGRVVQATAGGVEPVAGATVILRGVAGNLENPIAATVSDPKGSWVLCSSGAERAGTVEARKDGYAPASAATAYGWELDYVNLDLVLKRQ